MSEYQHVIGGRKEDAQRIYSEEHPLPKTPKEYLQQTKAKQLFPEKRRAILFVKSTDTLSHAFQILIENKIHSVPVWDERIEQYVTFLDMFDLVAHAVKHLKNLQDCSNDQFFSENDLFTKYTCGQITSASNRNPFYAVDEESPLFVVMELMMKHKMYRVPVIEKERGKLVTLITQSHVVGLLSESASMFPYSSKRLGELQFGTKPVHSIRSDQPALEAFQMIYNQKVNAVAVVDDQSRLIGAISATDFGRIGADGSLISRLTYSAGDFMEIAKRTFPEMYPVKPYAVTPSTTFEELLVKFRMTKAHRLFMVDETSLKPIGVISLIDVIEFVVSRR
jgi:CBS domain-containing protein